MTKRSARSMFFLLVLFTTAPSWCAEPQPSTILVLGDSLAAGYGVEPSEAFPALLQREIDKRGLPWKIINAGLSGDTTAGGLRRLDWLLRQKIDILLLELGGNDALRGVPLDSTRNNLEAIIDKVRSQNPSVAIVLAGMLAPPNLGPEYTTEFRDIYHDLARRENVHLIPFLLEGVAGRSDLNLSDGIHPTPEGHRRVAETVWTTLEPLLESRRSANSP